MEEIIIPERFLRLFKSKNELKRFKKTLESYIEKACMPVHEWNESAKWRENWSEFITASFLWPEDETMYWAEVASRY